MKRHALTFPQTAQPKAGSQINWGNPITRGLVSLYNPLLHVVNAFDSVKRSRSFTYQNGTTYQRLGFMTVGVAGRYFENNLNTGYVSTDIPADPKTTGCTMFYLFSAGSSTPSVTTGSIIGLGRTDSANNYFYVGQQVTTGMATCVLRDSGGGFAFNQTTGTQLIQGRQYFGAGWTDGASNHGFWINGTVYTGSTALGTFSAPTTYSIGCLARNSTGNGLYGTVGLAGVFNRVLGINEIQSLAVNPWQLYQPRRMYFGIAASGVTTGLSGSAITPSAGTHVPVFTVPL